jgi:hypothetical protein
LLSCLRELQSTLVSATRHLEPVQFLFDTMERIVADLVVGTHGKNSVPRRVDRPAVESRMCGSRGPVCAAIRICLCQMCGELLPQ